MSTYKIDFSNIFYSKRYNDGTSVNTGDNGNNKPNYYVNSPFAAPSLYWNSDSQNNTNYALPPYNTNLESAQNWFPFINKFFCNWADFGVIQTQKTESEPKTKPQITDIKQAGAYANKNKLYEKTLPDGTVILTHGYTRLEKMQPEWRDLQKYMVQAANELGLTLVYSDVCRTVAQSDKSRAEKGTHVAAGGKSPHNYGVAADIILLKDGKRINEAGALQKQFAQRASELSGGKIAWGGDPKYYGKLSVKERHHFEIRDWNKKESPNFCKTPEHLIKRYS